MPKIQFCTRRSGRYYFRRRVRLQDGKDIHVIVPLSTCDGQEARERVAMLAAQFDRIRRAVNAHYNLDDTLNPAMLKGLFETELRHCLRKFVAEFHDPACNPAARIDVHRTFASALDIAQRPGTTNELTDAQRQMLAAAGHDEGAIEWVAADLDRHCGKDSIPEGTLALMAEGLGLEPSDINIARLRHIHLLAQSEAHRLASHFLDEDVQSAFDQEEALLAKRRRNGEPLTFAPPAGVAAPAAALPSPVSAVVTPVDSARDDCLFKTYHTTRFSEVIPKILRLARAAGHWNMHSIRSLGSSFYAKSEAPDLMRADVMGHARTGTNALHYSKRAQTHGVEQVLAEYKAFMARFTDMATDHLEPHPVRLLPINHRSRTGKPRLKRS